MRRTLCARRIRDISATICRSLTAPIASSGSSRLQCSPMSSSQGGSRRRTPGAAAWSVASTTTTESVGAVAGIALPAGLTTNLAAPALTAPRIGAAAYPVVHDDVHPGILAAIAD